MANIITAGNSTNGGTSVTTDTSGTLNIVTGSGSGATAISVDTSQAVGIGTTSPSYKLDVYVNSAGIAGARILNASSSSGAYSSLFFDNDSAGTKSALVKNSSANTGNTGFANSFYMYYNDTGSSGIWNTAAAPIQFGTSSLERMRIDSSGNLIIAKTTTAATTAGAYFSASDFGALAISQATGNRAAIFSNTSGTGTGNITINASTTSYNTSSDYRLKEDIQPMVGALSKVAQLNPVTYKWKSDGSNGEGFIAHELAEVVPDCVTGEKDAVNEDGSIKPQGIDISFLVATLTAAIQELKTELDALKAKVGE
jgi:hypothetical protein